MKENKNPQPFYPFPLIQKEVTDPLRRRLYGTALVSARQKPLFKGLCLPQLYKDEVLNDERVPSYK